MSKALATFIIMPALVYAGLGFAADCRYCAMIPATIDAVVSLIRQLPRLLEMGVWVEEVQTRAHSLY